jgi:hypothetical protein
VRGAQFEQETPRSELRIGNKGAEEEQRESWMAGGGVAGEAARDRAEEVALGEGLDCHENPSSVLLRLVLLLKSQTLTQQHSYHLGHCSSGWAIPSPGHLVPSPDLVQQGHISSRGCCLTASWPSPAEARSVQWAFLGPASLC